MTMRASLIITAKDQASAGFGKIAGAARKMAGDVRGAVHPSTRLGSSIEKAGWTARTGAGQISSWAGNVRKAATDMRIAERAAYGLGYAIGFSLRKMGALSLGVGKLALGGGKLALGAVAATGRWALDAAVTTAKLTAAAGAAGAGWFIGGIIKTGSTFEQFQAQLEGTEGSAKKAKAAMAWVAKFAAQTPYQLDEVTDAFVRARGVGIDPLTGAMTKMGDAAAANRKTLMDAVEAIADAQTGEFERLKAFNITTSVKGNTVAFSYIDKAGKNAVRSTKKTAKDIQQAVLAIWDERHGGAMIRQSKTLAGIWSNLQDWVMGFQYRIAGKGIFDRVKNGLADLLDYANKLADDGTLEAWAQRISDKLSEMWDWGVKFVKGTDWAKVSTDLKLVAEAAWTAAKAFATMVKLAADVVDGVAKLANVKSWFRVVDQPRFGDANYGPSLSRKSTPENPKEKAPWWQIGRIYHSGDKPAVPPRHSPTKAAPGRTPLSALKPLPARAAAPAKQLASAQRIINDVKVGGRVGIEVDVKAPAGTQVRTKQLASDNRNVPITLKTGRAMAGAA